MSKERPFSVGIDQEKATRYLVIGIILAVGFGTLVLVSNMMAARADSWMAYEDLVNSDNYNKGVYGSVEYNARAIEIDLTNAWMEQQQLILGSIGLIGVNIGLIMVLLGFVGFATNNQLDEHTRRTCIILAGLIIFVLMVSFVGGLSLTIT